MFVSYSYPGFDGKLTACLFDLHGPSFVSSNHAGLPLLTYSYQTNTVPLSWCHLTQSTRRGHPCPLDTYLVYIFNKVGNRPVNMSIDQTSGHYWLKPVISGRLVVDWSIEITLVSSKVFSISHPPFTGPY